MGAKRGRVIARNFSRSDLQLREILARGPRDEQEEALFDQLIETTKQELLAREVEARANQRGPNEHDENGIDRD